MTEYDYSPEAYERYLNTQRRIADWVDQTEDCRPQFANALAPPPSYFPGADDPNTRAGRQGRRHHRRHSPKHFRSRSPSADSESDSEYGYGSGRPDPIPLRSAPGHLGGSFPASQLPWNQAAPPMMAQPQRPMPPSYYGAPAYPDPTMMRRSHSSHNPRHLYPPVPGPAPTPIYSPPVSPGVYGVVPPPPGPYITVVPTPPPHHRGPVPFVVSAAIA